jgi:hypothetical protein
MATPPAQSSLIASLSIARRELARENARLMDELQTTRAALSGLLAAHGVVIQGWRGETARAQRLQDEITAYRDEVCRAVSEGAIDGHDDTDGGNEYHDDH